MMVRIQGVPLEGGYCMVWLSITLAFLQKLAFKIIVITLV
jgi:hypothetical protein